MGSRVFQLSIHFVKILLHASLSPRKNTENFTSTTSFPLFYQRAQADSEYMEIVNMRFKRQNKKQINYMRFKIFQLTQKVTTGK